ncbi:hypothetical protein AGIG_G6388 [Arapaima gigas]
MLLKWHSVASARRSAALPSPSLSFSPHRMTSCSHRPRSAVCQNPDRARRAPPTGSAVDAGDVITSWIDAGIQLALTSSLTGARGHLDGEVEQT